MLCWQQTEGILLRVNSCNRNPIQTEGIPATEQQNTKRLRQSNVVARSGSPWWSGGGGLRAADAAQRFWLRKVRIHMEAPQSSRAQPLADSRTPAGSGPGTGRAQAGDGRPAREARAQPDPAAPKAPREQDLGQRSHC